MKLTKLRTVLTAVTVAAVAGVVALAIPANGAGTADNRFITVTGVGTISVVPEQMLQPLLPHQNLQQQCAQL
jgi:uncharacterized protein YggE